VGWKSAVAAFVTVLLSFAALMLYTRGVLDRMRACGADPLCQLSIVWEYTLVVIVAVLFILVLVDVVLRLGEPSERRLSLYPHAAHCRAGGRT
jgi:hypothetical protein